MTGDNCDSDMLCSCLFGERERATRLPFSLRALALADAAATMRKKRKNSNRHKLSLTTTTHTHTNNLHPKNEGENIAATLKSVFDHAATTPPLEVIVVDGGSRDDTRSVSRRAGARVVSAPRGRGAQLNAGLRRARGDWVLFLHADSRLPRNYDGLISAELRRARGRGGRVCGGGGGGGSDSCGGGSPGGTNACSGAGGGACSSSQGCRRAAESGDGCAAPAWGCFASIDVPEVRAEPE